MPPFNTLRKWNARKRVETKRTIPVRVVVRHLRAGDKEIALRRVAEILAGQLGRTVLRIHPGCGLVADTGEGKELLGEVSDFILGSLGIQYSQAGNPDIESLRIVLSLISKRGGEAVDAKIRESRDAISAGIANTRAIYGCIQLFKPVCAKSQGRGRRLELRLKRRFDGRTTCSQNKQGRCAQTLQD